MIPIKFYSPTLTELATISAASSALRKEVINGENVINFSVRIKNSVSNYVNKINLTGLGTDRFDIAYYKKEQQADGTMMVDVECEHVSYRLCNPEYSKEYYYKSDTPTNILADLLSGTGFTVGTVEFTTPVIFDSTLTGATAGESMTRRSLLMQFVRQLDGELDFNGFAISILIARGSSTPKTLTVGKDVTVISEAVDKRSLDDNGNPLLTYALGVYKGAALALGDTVRIIYSALGINVTLRIVSKSYDPYNPNNVTIEVGNTTGSIENVIQSIQTSKASKTSLNAYAQANKELNDLISHSFGYFRTTAIDATTGAETTYIHDQPTIDASVNIYVMTANGLAWTDQGWNAGNPTWQYGITASGNILAKILTVIGINATWINSGQINTDLILVGAQTLTEAIAGLTASIAAVSGGGTNFIQNSAWGIYDAPSLYWWYLGLTWQLLEKRIDSWTEFEANISTWAIFEAYTW